MKRNNIYIIILSFVSISLLMAAKSPVIEVLPILYSNGLDQSSLGSLVRVTPKNDRVSNLLNEAQIDMPKGSVISKISVQKLKKQLFKIRKRNRSLLSSYQIILPKNISIIDSNKMINVDTVKMRIRKILNRTCADCRAKFQFLQLEKVVSDADVTHWEIEHLSVVPKGAFSRQINVYKNNKLYDQFKVSGKIKLFKKVVVATHTIDPSVKVTKKDIRVVEREVTHANDQAILVRDLIGKKLKLFVNRGDIIWRKHIKQSTAIKYGDIVSINIGSANFKLSMPVKALKAGNRGDIISVVNIKTKKKFLAKVVESGKVTFVK